MKQWVRGLSIKCRLTLLVSFCTIALTFLGGAVVYWQVGAMLERSINGRLASAADTLRNTVQTAADVSIRNRLRAIAEKDVDLLAAINDKVEQGEMTLAQGQALAGDLLLTQTVGETGYIYCLDSDGVIVLHPEEQLVGKNLHNTTPVREQLQLKHGYMEYDWANPDDPVARPKALYMAYFEPWDWFVSASSYRDEFASLVQIEDFGSSIESMEFNETGYGFILDIEGNVIHHPTLSGNFAESIDEQVVKVFNRLFAGGEKGHFEYAWRDPISGDVRDKILYYRFVPELNWIIASSSYLDEAYAPLRNIRFILLITGVLIVLFVVPIAYRVGQSIAKPISQLASRMAGTSSDDLDIEADCEAPGEVGELATHFNGFMGRIREYRDSLQNEILERTRAEDQLQLFAMVYEHAIEGISITDGEGNIIAVNPAFTTITGYEADEVLGKNPRILKSDRHEPDFYRDMWASLKETGSWHGEIWNCRKNGEHFPEILSITSLDNDEPSKPSYIAVFHDISDIKRKEQEIHHQANHDALTGLPNRVLMQDRLEVAVSHAERDGTRVAIFYLDLDDFKKINDSLGHGQGDKLLMEVASRLTKTLQPTHTLGRLGGDEFLLMVEDVGDEREVVDYAAQLLEAFGEPFILLSQEMFVSASIGVTLFPDDGENADTLIKNADMAMYQSKAQGKNSYFLFTKEINERISRQIALESDMREALRNREFSVYFQPKVNALSSEVIGFEALIRWQKPNGAIVGPGEFIPLAEETGLIVPMGEFVLDASCKALQFLDGLGCADMSVSVNLSPVQFNEENLVDMVLETIERNGLASHRLELEITESMLMTDVALSVRKLNELVEAGLSIAIDDFGTGHSSLYYLKNFPLKVLKVDQSFVRDITVDTSDAQIVETIILMAKKLGMGVVAEGVETREQLDMLIQYGCEVIQGYYYSKPLPIEDVVKYLESCGMECAPEL